VRRKLAAAAASPLRVVAGIARSLAVCAVEVEWVSQIAAGALKERLTRATPQLSLRLSPPFPSLNSRPSRPPRSVALAMVQPQLPPGVLSEIISYIPSRHHDTLRACCLASKSFLPFARAQLYRSLTFDICTPTEKAMRVLTDRTRSHSSSTLRHFVSATRSFTSPSSASTFDRLASRTTSS